MAQNFDSWLRPDAKGLYCIPGGFHIDPHEAVDRAIITHGHSDHARSGHAHILSTVETLEVMKIRLGSNGFGAAHVLPYGENLAIGDVVVRLLPAGHILGSAQVVIEYRGQKVIVSGDYKRSSDPTCLPFELETCDLFITEATFALPVFRHEPDHNEVNKLLSSLQLFPERAHQVGAYSLGKAQRIIALLRIAGYAEPIWLHGAMKSMCDLYQNLGVDLGELCMVSETTDKLAGKIILCPPSTLGDRWSRRFADPLPCFASGWMRIRARARQRGVELPLIISDHVDWPELIRTLREVNAHEIWITHGRDDALTLAIEAMGLKARALAMVGFDEEEVE